MFQALRVLTGIMAKYRLLTADELKEFEKEFIEYLIVNGIDSKEWEELKRKDQEKANAVIDLFSDVVFESVMRKIRFLEFRGPKELKTFQCLPDKIILTGLSAAENSNADFTDPLFLREALSNPPEGFKIYTSEKKYSKPRELELFEMTGSGCVITDGQLFKTLLLLLADAK